MRKVLFATPCYDGKVHVEFLQSLLASVALAAQQGIALHPVQIVGDALVQRARNDFVKMALETECDDLIFMDSDQEWDPEWVVQLLSHPVDVVGCPVPKKSDTLIDFNVKVLPDGLLPPVNGLLQVAAVGTGFIRLSRKALQAVWDVSPEYTNSGTTCRMVYDLRITDGDLISEDTVFCAKWRALGGEVWVDPSMTCNHIGSKKWVRSFKEFING